MRLAVDLLEDLVQMLLPIRIRSHLTDPVSADLSREHRTKSVPPKPNRLVTDINPSLMQQVFNISQRKRISNIHHHRQADDRWARLEVLEWVTFCHPATLVARLARLNWFSSDSSKFPANSLLAGNFGLNRSA